MKSFAPLLSAFIVTSSLHAGASTVLIESNRNDRNSLLAFNLDASGKLAPKQEFFTMGKGIVDPTLALGPFDSDQEIIVSRERNLLLAVNSGSNSIAVFHIGPGGGLTAAQGSPFYSHGVNPVSLGLSGDHLTVVNKHGDPAQSADTSLPNYTEFWLKPDGQLSWIKGSTVEVALGSSPSQALISPYGPLVFGADFLGGLLQSFEVSPRGMIERRSTQALPQSAFANSMAPRLPLGLAANPHHPFVYVGLPTANKIAVYEYDRHGHLRFRRAIADSGTVVCWLLVNKAGTRLYASNTGDPSVTVYDIESDPTAPKEIQKLPLQSKGGAYQLALSPDENHLVVLTQRYQAEVPQGQGNELHVFEVEKSRGTLTESGSSPLVIDLPADTRPQGVVILN